MQKVQIFIDGGNFHHLALKKMGMNEIDFSFNDFANFLADNRIISQGGKRFYIGTVREEKGNQRSKDAMSIQRKFFSSLEKDKWEIKTSKLKTREERIVIDERVEGCGELLKKGIKSIMVRRSREKGIDVKIATDLIIAAMDNQYDTAIIVSSDTDLIPAIDIVKYRFNKKVEYIGFSILSKDKEDSKPSQALIAKSNTQRILVASDMERFKVKRLI
jgi:uncharacterized LabA/DUF88 family protein